MQASLALGLSVGLAAVLVLAAARKLRALTSFEVTLVQLLPRSTWDVPLLHSRRLAKVVVAVEVLTAAALLFVPSSWRVPVALWATVLFAAFLTALVLAARRRVPCSCFGRPRGAAGASAIIRGIMLLVISAWLAWVASGTDPVGSPSRVGALLVAGVVFVACVPGFTPQLGRIASHAGSRMISDSNGLSRRGFLVRCVALTALATLGASRTEPVLATSVECDALGDQCLVCCRPYGTSCAGCCDLCFAKCCAPGQTPCPPDSCFANCWDNSTTH